MSDDPRASTATAVPPRGGVRPARTLLWFAVLAAALVAALAGLVTTRAGSSRDGSFSSGDCVVLTSSAVRPAGCGGRHDGRVTGFLQQTYSTCPGGSEEFDVTDNTANLCVDRSR